MAAVAPPPFFTIGHSTRSLAGLVALLGEAEVRMVVDVRTIPRSRTNPQFNAETLPGDLATYQLGYEHISALGGLRGHGKGDSPNGHWRNESFRNYADHALTEAFAEGFGRLLALGGAGRVAVMCAEAVWWRCHRRIIADYLLTAGREVFHILGAGKIEPARMTPAARPRADGTIVYPAG